MDAGKNYYFKKLFFRVNHLFKKKNKKLRPRAVHTPLHKKIREKLLLLLIYIRKKLCNDDKITNIKNQQRYYSNLEKLIIIFTFIISNL